MPPCCPRPGGERPPWLRPRAVRVVGGGQPGCRASTPATQRQLAGVAKLWLTSCAGFSLEQMSKTKTVEWDELRTKNTAESAWLCIEGKVYDVTDFLDEHPGGEEVMLEVAGMEQRDAATSSRGGPFLTAIAAARFCLNPGKDATEEYVDVGHSDDARRMLEGSEAKIKLVGKVVRAGSESRERERGPSRPA